jgi:hypothetical protein
MFPGLENIYKLVENANEERKDEESGIDFEGFIILKLIFYFILFYFFFFFFMI